MGLALPGVQTDRFCPACVDIMCRQPARSQPGSKCTLRHQMLKSCVPSPLHSRVTIIISVDPSVTPLLLCRIPGTTLLSRWVGCRIPRLLVSVSRVNPTGALIALTGIRDTPTGTALPGYLLSGINQIICLHLLVSTRVYTPVMISTDMRR